VLRKGVGLCHGVGGSVYALLSASQILDSGASDGENARRAIHLALVAADWGALTDAGEMSTPDRPWSLYEGLAGMCCAWADVLRVTGGRAALGMPGYADIAYGR
jgi:hypothetical protein